MKPKNSAMITEDKVTEIFCIADDFCKVFDAQMAKYIHIPEHTRSAFWVCSQQSEVQKKALFDVRPSINGQKHG